MDDLVNTILVAGGGTAIFTYLAVRLIITPLLSRREDTWWHALAKNLSSLAIGVIVSFGLTFVLSDVITTQTAIVASLTGLVAAAIATYGHEVIANFGARKQDDG